MGGVVVKGLKFKMHEWSQRYGKVMTFGFDASYSYPPEHPLYSEQGDVFTARCNDVYRVGAMSSESGIVTLIMQHLSMSNPPYRPEAMPGRLVTMTFDEFSCYVDALVNLREKIKASHEKDPGPQPPQ